MSQGKVVDRITVCACTYQRPQGLSTLLESLRALRTPPGSEVEFCIIDNDVSPSARGVVKAAAVGFLQSLRYVHEPQPGIPNARNRALMEAGTDGYAVFVDDDETVDPDWLLELYRIAKETGGAFVQGPVEMWVEDANDQWWLETALFRQKVFPDGSPRHESWTNNVMLDMTFVSETNCRFDDALRFDGGSDTLFFRDMVQKGGTGFFAAHARVYEIQPKARLTWRWASQRQYRYGITRANVMKLRSSRPRTILYCLVRSAAMFVWSTGYFVTTIVRGRVGVANGVAFLARGTGVLLGGLGARKLEYARLNESK